MLCLKSESVFLKSHSALPVQSELLVTGADLEPKHTDGTGKGWEQQFAGSTANQVSQCGLGRHQQKD